MSRRVNSHEMKEHSWWNGRHNQHTLRPPIHTACLASAWRYAQASLQLISERKRMRSRDNGWKLRLARGYYCRRLAARLYAVPRVV